MLSVDLQVDDFIITFVFIMLNQEDFELSLQTLLLQEPKVSCTAAHISNQVYSEDLTLQLPADALGHVESLLLSYISRVISRAF